MNRHQLSSCPDTPGAEAPRLLGASTKPFTTGRFPRRIFVLVFFFSSLFAMVSLLTAGLAAAQSQKQIFPVISEISTPTTGGSGVLGDFNGDGKADLLT